MAEDVPYHHHPKSNRHEHNGSDIGGEFLSVDFDTDYSPEDHLEGRVFWDSQAGTIAIQTPYGTSTTQVGQESVIPAVNKTGVDINNGQLVYINDALGSRPTIALADASTVATSRQTIGFATVDIANNATGLVAAFGLVRDIDTSGFPAGTYLYLSETAGAFTDTAPTLPAPTVPVGIVVYQHVTQGIVLCDIKHCNCFASLGVGDVDGGDYTEFETDGTMRMHGEATVFNDWKFPPTRTVLGALGKPDYDYTNLGLLFPQNDPTEIIYIEDQLPHGWLVESTCYPHVHFIQTSASLPTWVLEYRFINNGGTIPGFTTISTTGVPVFTYPGSGSILQILTFPAIDMTGVALSAIFDAKFYRNDNVVVGDVLFKEFDIHLEHDTIGSRDEFTK